MEKDKIEFEIGQIRELTKQTEPFIDFDSEYTLYYDETNNIRKFYLKENKFNASYDANFVLGGIGYRGTKPKIDDLFEGLKLQETIKEVKLKHIAKGSFLECLKSEKLSFFLNYLLESNFFIHYSTVNILYYSIVDIVDSAIMNSNDEMKLDQQFAFNMKNDLYKLVLLNIDTVITLFYKYEYPNIKKETLVNFIEDLFSIFDDYEDNPEYHLGLTSLKQIMRNSKKNKSLPFLESQEEFVLLNDFFQFYLRPIYLLKNSTHIFDNEDRIQEIIQKYEVKDNGQVIDNYSFKESIENSYIQASDIFIGFVGKLFSFINSTSKKEIKMKISKLDNKQKQNLFLYINLVNKSDSINQVLLHNTASLDDMSKMKMIFELME